MSPSPCASASWATSRPSARAWTRSLGYAIPAIVCARSDSLASAVNVLAGSFGKRYGSTTSAAPAIAASAGAYELRPLVFTSGLIRLSSRHGAGRPRFAYTSLESSAAISASSIAVESTAMTRAAGATRGR